MLISSDFVHYVIISMTREMLVGTGIVVVAKREGS